MTDYVAELIEESKPEDDETDAEIVQPSLEEAQTFLKLLDPDAMKFNFQTYSDASTARKPRAYAFTLAPLYWSTLCKENLNGSAIAVSVQAMKGDERSSKNVAYVRAVFLDFDDGEPDWTAFALTPSIIVQTSPAKWHAYWLCGSDTSFEDFEAVQSALITNYHGDPACKDLARAMRLPGTLHMKRPAKPFLVRVTGGNHKRYTGAELRQAFVSSGPDGSDRTLVINPVSTKGILSGAGGAETTQQLLDKYRHAFASIPDCTNPALSYGDWATCGMALKADCGDTDEAFALFDEWSREKDPARYGSEEDCHAAWEGFRLDHTRPVRFGTVVSIVRKQDPDFFPLSFLATKQSAAPPNNKSAGSGRVKANIFDGVRSYLAERNLTLRTNDFTHGAELWESGNRIGDLDDGVVLDVWRGMNEDGYQIGKANLADVLSSLAREDHHHPVRDYLDSLEWDGEPRVENFFIRYGGVEDTPLHRAFGKAWMVAAIRRVRQPGCEFYGMPVLEDPIGGKGKSTLFKALASPTWFDDNMRLGDTSKEIMEVATGKWLIEVPELSGLGNRAFEHVKAMITRTTDTARLSYGRYATSRPRQFVLAGTTNDLEYGRDGGMRRFWSMRVVAPMDVEGVRRDRDQLWAEAAHLEARGEPHNIPESLWDDAREAQQERTAPSAFEATFGDKLDDAPEGFLPTAELMKACKQEGLNVHTARAFTAEMEKHGFQKVNLRDDGTRRRGYQKGGADVTLKYTEAGTFAKVSRARL